MGIQVLSALIIFTVVFLTNEVLYVVLAYIASFTVFRGLALWTRCADIRRIMYTMRTEQSMAPI